MRCSPALFDRRTEFTFERRKINPYSISRRITLKHAYVVRFTSRSFGLAEFPIENEYSGVSDEIESFSRSSGWIFELNGFGFDVENPRSSHRR